MLDRASLPLPFDCITGIFQSVMRPLFRAAIVGTLLFVAGAEVSGADRQPGLFDAHLHYNGETRTRLSAAQALAKLDRAGVRAVIATSTPNDGSLELFRAAEGHTIAVVPFLRPYRSDADRGTWFDDPAIAAFIDGALARERRYRGIGEFHVHGAADAKGSVMRHIVELAVARDLWLHAHCDDAALETIFALDPRVKVVWAHTGFTTPPAQIARYLAEHPTLMAELSYRGDIASGATVSDAWRALLLRYPDRFILGSDTWTDDRWTNYQSIIDAYRAWLADLPPAVAAKLQWDNGARMFALPQVK